MNLLIDLTDHKHDLRLAFINRCLKIRVSHGVVFASPKVRKFFTSEVRGNNYYSTYLPKAESRQMTIFGKLVLKMGETR